MPRAPIPNKAKPARPGGAAIAAVPGLRALALHIKVYLSATHTRRCSCTTLRNYARRRRAAIRPRQLRLSTVRRAPRAAARCPQRPAAPRVPAHTPRLRAPVFCGIGGASAGARSAGLDVALGVDSHAQRLGVFKLNFAGAESVCGQLAVSGSVFTEDMLKAKLPKGDFHQVVNVVASRQRTGSPWTLISLAAPLTRRRWTVTKP